MRKVLIKEMKKGGHTQGELWRSPCLIQSKILNVLLVMSVLTEKIVVAREFCEEVCIGRRYVL